MTMNRSRHVKPGRTQTISPANATKQHADFGHNPTRHASTGLFLNEKLHGATTDARIGLARWRLGTVPVRGTCVWIDAPKRQSQTPLVLGSAFVQERSVASLITSLLLPYDLSYVIEASMKTLRSESRCLLAITQRMPNCEQQQHIIKSTGLQGRSDWLLGTLLLDGLVHAINLLLEHLLRNIALQLHPPI